MFYVDKNRALGCSLANTKTSCANEAALKCSFQNITFLIVCFVSKSETMNFDVV